MSFTNPKTWAAEVLTSTDMNAQVRDNINYLKLNIALDTAIELTIDTDGIVTKTYSHHTIDTFEDAASDNLVTISGGAEGELLLIRAAHTDRTVVIDTGAGNIINPAGSDISLTNTDDYCLLTYNGTNWIVIGGGSCSVDDLYAAGQEQGDVLYFNGTSWVILHHGTAGDFLKSGGNAANPSWQSPDDTAGGTDTSIVPITSNVHYDHCQAADPHAGYVLESEVDDVPVDGVTSAPISSNWAFDLTQITREPTGFPNITDTSKATFASPTITLAKTGTSFDYYIKGVKYTKTVNQTVALPNGNATDTGTWYIYFSAGTLTATKTTSWDIGGADVCPVAVLYFNGTAGRICDERHGTVMDAATHDLLHYTVGCRYESGLIGTFTDPANISIALGKIHDEDLEYSIGAQTTCIPFYHSSGVYTFASAQNSYVVQVSNILQYDNLTNLTDVTNNKYVAYWIFATMDSTTPIWSMPGQREDTLLKDARDNNKYESLTLGTLPFPEMKLLYRVIMQRSGTDEVYVEAQDLRTVSNLPSGTYVATDHGSLTGLLDDDHTQYTLRSLYDAYSILFATTDDTPIALTVNEQEVVGRLTGGTIDGIALGLADNNILQVDDADAIADNDYLKATAAGVEGRTYANVKSDLTLNLVENTAHSTDAHTMTIDGVDVSAHAGSATAHGLVAATDPGGAALLHVMASVNGATVWSVQDIFDATNPAALAAAAAPGTAVVAAHRDHVHLDPVVAHAALTTGIHGAGTSTLASVANVHYVKILSWIGV